VTPPPPPPSEPITPDSVKAYQMYPVISVKGEGYFIVGGVPAKLAVLHEKKEVREAIRQGQNEFTSLFQLEPYRHHLNFSLGNMGEELVSFDKECCMQEVYNIKIYNNIFKKTCF
jgi:hypothetical protein